MYYLGIDIAKTNHFAALLDQDGKVVIRNIRFTNSNEGYKSLLETISCIAQNQKMFLLLWRPRVIIGYHFILS